MLWVRLLPGSGVVAVMCQAMGIVLGAGGIARWALGKALGTRGFVAWRQGGGALQDGGVAAWGMGALGLAQRAAGMGLWGKRVMAKGLAALFLAEPGFGVL